MISDNDVLKLIMGFKVKHLRSSVGVSYQELSNRTGLSVSYLNDIEKGKKYPKPDKIRMLAQAFKVSYDELVSTQADKKLRPVVELLNSGFFKYFPTDEFGLNLEKLIDIFSNSPDKISAFISTILKMVRSYQIEKEHFYRVALRSYQDMHDNYFPALEIAADNFKEANNLKVNPSLASLKRLLTNKFLIVIDDSKLGNHDKLKRFRSYYSESGKKLYVNGQLSDEQQKFLIAKELGFQQLAISERPHETTLNKEASFEKLLNNFKASYFAASLLMSTDELVKDLQRLSVATSWSPKLIESLLKKYQVTPETLLQRLSNILPKHFGIDNLFFIRLDSTKGLVNYRITKELHLSGLHKPYQNQLEEHLCHRWVSISSIKQLNSVKADYVIDAQVSEYWQTDNAYFCISIAEPDRFDNHNGTSVTLGLSMNESLKGAFNFMKDPALRRRTVHTTCEQCSISDCEHRVAPATIVNKRRLEEELDEELKKL